MPQISRSILAQPQVGIVGAGVALAALAALWLAGTPGPPGRLDLTTLVVSLALLGAVIASYHWPIHVYYHLKILVSTVPLYLLLVVAPVPLGVTGVGLAILLGDLSVRARRGLYPSDIATSTARWIVIAGPAAWVAHLPVGDSSLRIVPLAGAAALLWLGDFLTGPFVLVPISGESFTRVLVTSIREMGVAEAVQYLIGILGALAAAQQVWVLALLPVPVALIHLAFKSAKEMHEGTRLLLESMADAVDLSDPSKGGHSRRVTAQCQGTLAVLKIDPTGPTGSLIIAAARVHDIGKIGVPDEVLHQPGPLTPAERALLETHPERGADLLGRYPDFRQGAEIVRHHHERWNGSGYPHGLQGPAIPLGARIIAVADAFDALTTDRPAQPGLSGEAAAALLLAGQGADWDPQIVAAFLQSIAGRLASAPPPARAAAPLPDEAPADLEGRDPGGAPSTFPGRPARS